MKKLLALLLALIMVFSLIACAAKEEATETPSVEETPAVEESPAEEAPAEEATGDGEYKYKVAFATISQANDTMVNQAENMKAYGKQHGVEVVIYDNKSDASVAVQNAELIARDGSFDAVLNFNVDATVAPTIAEIYENAGLPAIAIDVEHPGEPFFGADNYKCGELCGQYLAEYATENWGGDIDRLVIMDQLTAGELPRQRVLNAQPTLEAALGITLDDSAVYTIDCKDVLQAQTDFASYLQANPDAKHIAVVCLSEDHALGVASAAAAANRTAEVCCVTNNEDATISSWETETEETCVRACVSFTFTHYGKWLIPAVVELLETGSCAEQTYVGHELVTRDNMAEYRASYPSRVE